MVPSGTAPYRKIIEPIICCQQTHLPNFKWLHGLCKKKIPHKKGRLLWHTGPFCYGLSHSSYRTIHQTFPSTSTKHLKVIKQHSGFGANSPSLDIEKIDSLKETKAFSQEKIEEVLQSLQGKLEYYPPKFCAKKINGKRAYELAREGKEVDLKTITSNIYDIKLINYNHPFVHFEAKVSEGTYIRSLGALIADKLKVDGTLSSLHRIHEGQFYFDNEKALNPFTHLALPSNTYTGEEEYMEVRKKTLCSVF